MTDADEAEHDAGAVRRVGTVLYESERARVIRSPGADGEPGAVIWKEPLGPGAAERLRHEVAILSRLTGVTGVAQLAQPPRGGTRFALIDVGGVSLASDLGGRGRAERGVRSRADVVALATFALSLVRVLAGVHREGVLHLDVNPANILVGGPGREPFLIDWELASTAPEELPGFTHETTIAGTPAYLAPEQTGRTGRGVDHRTDLYAVGATLYELAVGAPPFGDRGGDTFALIHDHLARIPTAPHVANERVPAVLSDIIVRLLEKEPDRRYQSAAGLAHDLARLLAALTAADPAPDPGFPLGEHDFPTRICAPSQLVGRATELTALRTSFDLAMAGQGRGLLVTGAPGVGKTALVDELRAIVAAAGGWYVQGRFDQYRQDVSTDAVTQVMRALARLLLAEPEARVAAVRARIEAIVGADTSLVAAMCPEYAVLLDTAPGQLEGETEQLAVRLRQAGLGVLRAIVSPERPIVMVIDNLQWAGAYPIEFLGAVLTDEELPGLLLVGAYRDGELEDSPLPAMAARWVRIGAVPTRLHLENLPAARLGSLLADMLRLPPERAAELADAVDVHTGGNPYDTVELVNALRREGILSLGDTGWQWAAAAVRSYIGSGDAVQLLTQRIDGLPTGTARLLEVLACLGGEVEVDLFGAAVGLAADVAAEYLAPAIGDGLLVMIHDGPPAVRFRHDRVQQAAFARLGPQPRRTLNLELARRLVAHPDQQEAAAEQYLAGAADVTDPAEQYRVAQLFRAAAARLRLINQAQAERFLATALTLLRAGGAGLPDGAETLVTQLLIDRHAALHRLARLAAADQLYEAIEHRVPDATDLAEPAARQIVSLARRSRQQEAVTLGIALLARLGCPQPAAGDRAAELDRGMELLYAWVAEGPAPDELDRPESDDPQAVAAACLIARILPAAFRSGHSLMPWLLFTAHRLWVAHGPSRPLVTALGAISVLGVAIRQDYAVGYQVCRRILSVSETHGYEPETSQLRNTVATFGTPWFEPVEEVARLSRSARDCLLRHGELQFASFTYVNTLWAMLDCAPTLDACVAENHGAMTFWARTGDESLVAAGQSYQQLLRCLRGETDVPGGFDDSDFDEVKYLAEMSADLVIVCNLHWLRALAAVVFGDTAGLAAHAAAAFGMVHHRPGMYSSALIYFLRGLALARSAGTAAPAERPALLTDLDACRGWLAARAADAPDNFAHLVGWLDAERAWAQDDFRDAVRHFDAAMSRAGSRRPGHAAMITEQAARCHLAHGLDRIGRLLLAEARDRYDGWGAAAKVAELHREFPFLRSGEARGTGQLRRSGHSTVVSSDAIDLLAVVRASQALSSETNLDTLRIRVVEVLTALTGATSVRLLLWNEDARDWFLSPSDGPDGPAGRDGRAPETALRAGEAGAAGMICLSAFRYAERTREPLVVPDATRDDRFCRDPYLKGMSSCSLLVMPIVSRGTLRAMLLMENTLSPGIFTSHRLDTVVLIAGQLTVSLDNALAERFRSLVQLSSGLTLVCDRDGILTYASSASVDILGAQDVSLTGRPVAELVDPQDREAFAGWIGDGGLEGQLLECRVTPTGSGPRWVEVSCTDLTADPAVAGLVLHLRDVSERRQLEGELRHAQKLESVGQLAAGVAHEINTPIQFISNNLIFIAESIAPMNALLEEYRQALSDDVGPADLAARRQAFAERETEIDLEFLREELPLAADQALEGAERVAKIVRAMKAFAHPGGEQKGFADLNEAIRNTLIMATSEIKLVADVVLSLGEIPPVWCNLGDINQAVLNLVVNAAHAIGEAAGTGRGRGTLTVRTRADEAGIVVEIQDTGNGIPPEIADRVFEHFFTTKPVGVGTGQGLALAYTLVHDRHGGTVTFASEPGAGTTFTIRLPQPAASDSTTVDRPQPS